MKLLCCCVLLAACAAEPDESLDSTEQALSGGCPDWGCGTNSPVIDGLGFHELNIQHLTNTDGFKIESVTTPWSAASYDIKVQYGQIKLTKIGTMAGPTLVEHDRLRGSILHLDHYGTKYDLTIMFVFETPMWVGTRPSLESYQLTWQNPLISSGADNVCSNPTGAPSADGTMDMPAYEALVFEGERINASKKEIYGVDPHWFNIACAGSPLAKMYLTGHVGAAVAKGFSTTVPERQTMLKMYAADYCGGGFPFTVAGQPLEYRDNHGWLTINRVSKIEARWTPDGAACLTTPRILANPTTAGGAAAFPSGIWNTIHDVCGRMTPLPCTDEDLTRQDGYHLISGNPITP